MLYYSGDKGQPCLIMCCYYTVILYLKPSWLLTIKYNAWLHILIQTLADSDELLLYAVHVHLLPKALPPYSIMCVTHVKKGHTHPVVLLAPLWKLWSHIHRVIASHFRVSTFIWYEVHYSKTVQLPYGFYTCHLDSKQSAVNKLVETRKESMVGFFSCYKAHKTRLQISD